MLAAFLALSVALLIYRLPLGLGSAGACARVILKSGYQAPPPGRPWRGPRCAPTTMPEPSRTQARADYALTEVSRAPHRRQTVATGSSNFLQRGHFSEVQRTNT